MADNAEQVLRINIDDAKARVSLKNLDSELEKLVNLASTGIRMNFDEHGDIQASVTRLRDEFGRIVTINQRFAREFNEETQEFERVEHTTANIAINLEKMAREEERRARIRQREEAQEQREWEQANRLLELEERTRRETEARLAAQGEIAIARENELRQAQRQMELESAFTSARLQQDAWARANPNARGFSNITTEIADQSYYNRVLGVTRDRSRINAETSVFGRLSNEAFQQYSTGAINAAQATRTLGEEEEHVEEQTERTTHQVGLLERAVQNLAMRALRSLVSAFKDALSEMKAVDSELVVVRKVTDATDEQLTALRDRAYEVGKAYGVVASDYLSSAAEFSRAGYKEQAGDLAELATKLQLVGDVSQDVANQFLIATDKAYGLKGNYEQLSVVIDQLNEIDNNYATSIEKIAQGMGIIAPIASQAHVSIEELSAAIGTITATTQRSGAESARALRAIFLNIMGDTKTEIEDGATWTAGEIEGLRDVLNLYAKDVVKAAEASGEVINPMKAIAALSESYKSGVLTEAKLMEMISDIGGKLRSSQLMALIQNWDMYNEMIETTKDAVGSADKEVSNALTGWQAKLNILTNTWTDFVQKSLDTNFIKGGIDALTWLIDASDNLGTAITVAGLALIAFNSSRIVGAAINGAHQFTQNLASLIMNLYGTQSAAAVASIAISAFAAVIAAAIIGISMYKQSLDNAISKGKEAQQDLSRIQSLYNNYKKLNDEAAGTKEAINARETLIETLKDEGVWVDSVTGKYNTLSEKIEAATQASIDQKRVQLNDALRAANEQVGWINVLGGAANAQNAAYFVGLDDYTFDEMEGARYRSAEELLEIYDRVLERRLEIVRNGESGSEEDIQLYNFVKRYGDALENVRLLSNSIKEYESQVSSSAAESTDSLSESVEKESAKFAGLADEINGATSALARYQAQIEAGKKGDTTKSYATIWEEAKAAYENGQYGATELQSALELFLPKELIRSLNYDAKELGKTLFGDAFEALYGGGGNDYGANFARWLRENADSYKHFYDIIENGDGTFDLMIQDEQGLADALGMTVEQIYAFVDSLGVLDGKYKTTKIDIQKLIEDFGNAKTGKIDAKGVVEMMQALYNREGSITESDLYNLLQTLEDMGVVASKDLPEDFGAAYDAIEKVAETAKDFPSDIKIEVETEPTEGIFKNVWGEIKDLEGHTIVIGVKYTVEEKHLNYLDELNTGNGNYQRWRQAQGHNWTGVRNAKGGLSRVNELGAELIITKDGSYVANGGMPTTVMLHSGDSVLDAATTSLLFRPVDELGNTENIKPIHNQTAFGGSGISVEAPSAEEATTTSSGSGYSTSNVLDLLKQYFEQILNTAETALNDQIAAIDAQMLELRYGVQVAEQATDLEEARLEMIKAEQNLTEAQTERTVRYFNKATGQWEWMADKRSVVEAQEALADAQKDYLQEQYKALETAVQSLLERMQNTSTSGSVADIGTILAMLGSNENLGDIQGVLAQINSFIDNPGAGLALLDSAAAASVLLPKSGSSIANLTGLTALYGISTGDVNAKGQSIISTLDRSSTTYGNTYYINGVKIGNDMLDKPLSEVLSVLPIYAN